MTTMTTVLMMHAHVDFANDDAEDQDDVLMMTTVLMSVGKD